MKQYIRTSERCLRCRPGLLLCEGLRKILTLNNAAQSRAAGGSKSASLRCLLLIWALVLGSASGEHTEHKLTQYLLANYDPAVRPSLNASLALNVTFSLALTQIIDVDERNQILTTNCWLNQLWVDHSLTWDPADFDQVKVIRLPATRLWRPDVILYNNADSHYNTAVLSTNIIVSHDGNITWLSSAIFKSSCAINVEFFPFDEQRCHMKFASWTYDGYQVNLTAHAPQADLTNYVTNGEWDLVELSQQRHVVRYSCCDAPYPDLTYLLVLRRRPLFYVFNLILPCVLITGIALLSFYMPSDSGEKVTLGITTLLSMTVFLMVIGESMPPTSEKLPLIGLYYGVTISLVSFATGLSVVTLNIHHRGMRGRPVPHILRKLVLQGLAKLLLIRLDLPDPLGRNRNKSHRCGPSSEETGCSPPVGGCSSLSPGIGGCSSMCSQGSSPCLPTPPPPLLHNSTSISTVTTTLHHPCCGAAAAALAPDVTDRVGGGGGSHIRCSNGGVPHRRHVPNTPVSPCSGICLQSLTGLCDVSLDDAPCDLKASQHLQQQQQHLQQQAQALLQQDRCLQQERCLQQDICLQQEQNRIIQEGVTPTTPCRRDTRPSLRALDDFDRHLSRVLHKVQDTIERNELRLAEQDRRDTIRLEWQQVALIVDRLLLWVFLVATVSSTFSIMYMSPHTRLFTAY